MGMKNRKTFFPFPISLLFFPKCICTLQSLAHVLHEQRRKMTYCFVLLSISQTLGKFTPTFSVFTWGFQSPCFKEFAKHLRYIQNSWHPVYGAATSTVKAEGKCLTSFYVSPLGRRGSTEMLPGVLGAEGDLPGPFMLTSLPKQFLVSVSRCSIIKKSNADLWVV